MTSDTQPLWTPSRQRVESAHVTHFARAASADWNQPLDSYTDLYRWSVEESARFWQSLWKFAAVRGTMGTRALIDAERMPGARWFPDAQLNFAENLLRRRDAADAIVFWAKTR